MGTTLRAFFRLISPSPMMTINIVLLTQDGKGKLLHINVASMLLDFVVEHSSISMLDESISDYEDKIYELQRRLADKEESYWKKFSAMEVALNKMNSQSSWISQQLGMGSGGY